MKKYHQTNYATLSLVSIGVTLLFAAITHVFKYGYPAAVQFAVILIIIYLVNFWFQRSGNKIALSIYFLLNTWIILGFGLINGFWNHIVKLSLFYLHNGTLPPMLAQMFSDPGVGNMVVEIAGILTFIASLFSVYNGYRLIQNRKFYLIKNFDTGSKIS